MSLPPNVVNTCDVTKTPFLMFQCHPSDFDRISRELLTGVQEVSELSQLFFHPKNIERIQKMIIKTVLKKTRGEYLIERQNEKDLQVVMRSIFLQRAKHWNCDLMEQVEELNLLVVDDVVPNIISEIEMYFAYLERAFGRREIIDLPECTSQAGSKTIPSVSSVWK